MHPKTVGTGCTAYEVIYGARLYATYPLPSLHISTLFAASKIRFKADIYLLLFLDTEKTNSLI